MADEQNPNQSPNVGVPPQQGQPQAPAHGVPGVAPPPRPPPNEAQIIAQQKENIARQIAEAQQRQQQLIRDQQQHILQQQQSGVDKQQQAASPVQGLTPEQVAAGMAAPSAPGQQPGFINPGVQATTQLSQYAPAPAAVDKAAVQWHPMRNSLINIELTDVIIKGIPDGIKAEPDQQAQVVLALFSEVLALRDRIMQLEAGGMSAGPSPDTEMRIRQLEGALYEQKGAMQSRARGVREQIELFTAKGMNAEEIVAALQEQSDAAAQLAATAPSAATDESE